MSLLNSAAPADFEGMIYSFVMIFLYLLLLAVGIVVFHMDITVITVLQQIGIVFLTIVGGVTIVRKFRKQLCSLMSVLTNTNLVTITPATSPISAAAALTAAATASPSFSSMTDSSHHAFPLEIPDIASTAAAFGLELFSGDPNF